MGKNKKRAEREGGPPSVTSAPPEVPGEAPIPEVKGQAIYEVAPNRSITSLRGVLGPGMGVKPEYFVDGVKSIVALNNLGALVKRKK